MKLQLESNHLDDYLQEAPPTIEWHSPRVQAVLHEIRATTSDREKQAKIAFEIARDRIAHSFDSQAPHVSIGAADTLEHADGICFAKSHLLASLLRGLGIPTGFCYQRKALKGNPDNGHALHGLNALYLEPYEWFRVDPRGNKEGIDAQFTTDHEQLAYPIDPSLGEIDYPDVLVSPLPSVIQAMTQASSTQELFYQRPSAL